ncbi:MAG: OmpA family protein [Proteobacteria bacterium]|nr:OmpA family protein [Pseudomonadota bacterium]
MKSKAIVLMVAALFVFTGCSTMSKRAKCACVGAAAGAAVGGTAGAIIGDMGPTHDNRLGGGLIGGGAGALIGGIIGYMVCKEEPVPPPVKVEEPKCDKIVINSVQFDFDKAVIKPEFYPILDEAAAALQKPACATKNVTIEGNTCNMGSDKYNQKLSEKRAAAAKQYMVDKGLSAARFTAVGSGEANPIADNKTKKGRAMNRRVEFKIAD